MALLISRSLVTFRHCFFCKRSLTLLQLPCYQNPRALTHTWRSMAVAVTGEEPLPLVGCQDSMASADSASNTHHHPAMEHAAAAVKESVAFLAHTDAIWASQGISQHLLAALTRNQLHHPSFIQAAAIPHILDGADVVIAAETGSGKSHAYLVPLFQKILDKKHKIVSTIKQSMDQSIQQPRDFALVLCPNAVLCEQVAHMARCLTDECRMPLLEVTVVCGGQGWPTSQPDLVIATPAALLNYLFTFDPKRRHRNAFVRDVKHVVFDEADMLLSGGFENQTIRLLDMLRLAEKQISKPTDNATEDLRSMRPWTDFQCCETDIEEELDVQEENHNTFEQESEAIKQESEILKQEEKPDWLRYRKIYKRSKQYLFVAATLPDNGKKTPGAILRRRFPDAKWISGSLLHCHNPRLQYNWVEVTTDTQLKVLLESISEDQTLGAEITAKRTMVFANSVQSVEDISGILRRAGFQCLTFHRDIPSEERVKILEMFQQNGGVLVCTDSAARGIDILSVNHVIQAEFAKSAIEFLHRVGRTARAGHYGSVTSLYNQTDKCLVEAVKQAAIFNQPLEGAFSRKRSFRKKIRKGMLRE